MQKILSKQNMSGRQLQQKESKEFEKKNSFSTTSTAMLLNQIVFFECLCTKLLKWLTQSRNYSLSKSTVWKGTLRFTRIIPKAALIDIRKSPLQAHPKENQWFPEKETPWFRFFFWLQKARVWCRNLKFRLSRVKNFHCFQTFGSETGIFF